MRKYFKALLIVSEFLCIALHAETIQLGGVDGVRTAGWLELSGESGVNNVQPISYTDTNGITFTVTATASAGQMVAVLNTGLAVVGGLSDTRIDSAESLELTLSVSGGNLSSLSASFFAESLLTGEGFDVSDGTNTAVIAELASSLVEYGTGKELDGLTPLTENNLSTWRVNFSVNAGYPATKGLLGALILDYTVATNPPPQFPLYAEADELYSNTNTYDLTQETYTFSELWSTPVQSDITFLPEFYNSPIATRGDDTFVLFVDPDHRMKIAHLTNGVFHGETFIDNTLYQPDEFYANHDADPLNDVTVADYHRFRFEDSHHSIALGIDEYGYLHLVGDMHNYPRYEGSMDHLPLRYFDKYIMYWRSDNPLDISSFSFKGDQAGECPAGSGFTYQFFFNDLYGKLHMTSRAQQTWNNGTRCATYSSYDADSGLWSIIGGAPDPSDPASIPCTFYDDGWEYDLEGGTTNSSGKYSKLRPHGVFDRQNNMHLVTPMLRDPTFNPLGMGNGFHFSDCVVYAQSQDGGSNFTSVGGSEIILPATVNLTTNRAEIIYGEQPGEYLSPNGQVAVDYQNHPYTVTQIRDLDTSTTEVIVIGWDGSNWINHGVLTSAPGDFRLVNDPAGVMSYIGDGSSVLYRFWNPTNIQEITTPWPIRVIDYEYQKQTGNLMGLANIGGELAVVKMEINNRPGMTLLSQPAATVTNHPPEITAQATLNGQTLSVSAIDADMDTLTYTWSKSYGPGEIVLSQNGTTASSNTTLFVSEEGTYEIKVAVSDGHTTRISTCTAYLLISPNSPVITTAASASPDTVTLPGTSTLSVAATNAVAGGVPTFTWSKVSGPGDVSFSINGTSASSNTVASFNAIGTYELQVFIANSAGFIRSSCTVTAIDANRSFDDFQSNDWLGGTGWNGDWTVTTGGSTPPDLRELSGNYAVLLRDGKNNQSITRTLANGIASGMLTFKWDVGSMDSSTEYGYAEVYDGTWHTVWSMNNSGNGVDVANDPDNLQVATVDLASYGTVTQIRFRTSDNTGTADYFFIDDVEIESKSPYIFWIVDNNLSGSATEYNADTDGDGINNLGEYALGGDPNTNDFTTILPASSRIEEAGTNWFNYTYSRRLDAMARGLTYEVQTATNLVSNVWTNNTVEVGSEIVDINFESVTNRISADGKTQLFIRLKVDISE